MAEKAKLTLSTNTFRGLVAGGIVTAGLTSGYLVHRHRVKLLTERRESIHDIRRELSREYRALEEDINKEQHELKKELAAARRRTQVIDTIWGDRRERYEAAMRTNDDYIRVLPESMTILRGLVNHYDYMSKAMPRFAEFDFLNSKLHTFGVLLAASKSSPDAETGKKPAASLVFTIPQFRFLFNQEPTVSAVLDSLDPEVLRTEPPKPDQIATSIASLSSTFALAQKHLRAASDARQDRCFEEEQERIEEELRPKERADGQSAIVDGFKHLTNFGRVSETLFGQLGGSQKAEEQQQEIERRQREAAERFVAVAEERMATQATILRTKQDVIAAIDYVRSLKQDDFDDPATRLAIAEFGTWRYAAEQYLVEEQALAVLNAYHQCLQTAAVKVGVADGPDYGKPQVPEDMVA